ncbi:MAG: hypothetical protein ABW019_08505 [Chitinophagaceae bacterium]
MPWGRVTITYPPTNYLQYYKRNHVITDQECQAMVAAAVADAEARINIFGAIVVKSNIAQDLEADPGPMYRVI